ncbi:EcoAI/FtnUII family type I restriction enzme subunit R [Pontibacter sp. HSC-36F09]|uniref:EcoAI/FtnUII family type I restriction enzme subunit R n=1 Tax=Pontibacter sp. HSC-36F09 TaxID=2910966 RepID=UPI00209EA1B5|nr:DEAD/DEAH box helicase family protein [Pontibacter sp. HSC-36F09]MCP2044711.1 type I restriction enzyme R subunit [Pontibacter sp. HSC-36F09]
MLNKKALTERDICTKFITPALTAAGWDIQKQVREEWAFTDGRIIVRGHKHTRGQRKRADYVLFYKSTMVAIIEAKDNNHSVGHGMQQAKDYADILDIPFIYSSNGDAFLEHDKSVKEGIVEKELSLEEFPTPEALWQRYATFKNLSPQQQEVVKEENHKDETDLAPRYYQQIAINRTIEAVARGEKRTLLVMATGTGKTYTAFQIIWRLWKARTVKRVLYLADRNILVDQTKTGDFRPFGSDIMTKIQNRQVDKSYQIYFALYQGLTGNEEDKNIFKQFSPDFFDMVVVDECHRGSAKEESAWRDVLTYFDSAIHLGLTATPKETKDTSNITYFGEPVYTYSLKQGIDDGFLAPYKVVRISLNVDEGYRPEKGKIDKYGHEIEDRIYNTKDFDRNLVIDDRTKAAARKISEYLKLTDRMAKTIVFCVDTEHAERMRQALVNENSDMLQTYPKYVVRITGDDEIGKKELYNFSSVLEKEPVIATTSKLLTTGVDTKMVKLIVLEAGIQSMTEFKQIIGRGTRLREDDGKVYFSIMDFRQVTNLFADPDFDGDPVVIYEPGPDEPPVPPVKPDDKAGPDDKDDDDPITDPPFGPKKYYVNDVAVAVINERVQYYGADGKLITESLKNYSRNKILSEYTSMDDFLIKWNESERKEAIINELAEKGVLFEELQQEIGKDMDAFDLIVHIAFDRPPLTRKERAEEVKKRNYFEKYGSGAREVLQTLLEKYADEGISSLENNSVLTVKPLNQFGTPIEIVKRFGKKADFEKAINELEQELYRSA